MPAEAKEAERRPSGACEVWPTQPARRGETGAGRAGGRRNRPAFCRKQRQSEVRTLPEYDTFEQVKRDPASLAPTRSRKFPRLGEQMTLTHDALIRYIPRRMTRASLSSRSGEADRQVGCPAGLEAKTTELFSQREASTESRHRAVQRPRGRSSHLSSPPFESFLSFARPGRRSDGDYTSSGNRARSAASPRAV